MHYHSQPSIKDYSNDNTDVRLYCFCNEIHNQEIFNGVKNEWREWKKYFNFWFNQNDFGRVLLKRNCIPVVKICQKAFTLFAAF